MVMVMVMEMVMETVMAARHTLVAEKGSRHFNKLATDKNNTLSVQKLLGNNRGKAPEEMAFGINYNLIQN